MVEVNALHVDGNPIFATLQAEASYNKYSHEHKEDYGEQLSGVSTLRPFVIALNPAVSSIGQVRRDNAIQPTNM